MSRIDSLTRIRVRLTHVTAQVSPTSLERIRQAWAGVPMWRRARNFFSAVYLDLLFDTSARGSGVVVSLYSSVLDQSHLSICSTWGKLFSLFRDRNHEIRIFPLPLPFSLLLPFFLPFPPSSSALSPPIFLVGVAL
jgi:hypothetical protein